MSKTVRAILALVVAIILGVAAWLYFSDSGNTTEQKPGSKASQPEEATVIPANKVQSLEDALNGKDGKEPAQAFTPEYWQAVKSNQLLPSDAKFMLNQSDTMAYGTFGQIAATVTHDGKEVKIILSLQDDGSGNWQIFRIDQDKR